MPIWQPAPIEDEPSIQLRYWKIMEVRCINDEAWTRHFLGERADRTGRASTAIEVFDAATRRGRTSTGRVYTLVGKPGASMDAEYVWQMFCRINEVTEARDITKQVISEQKKARPARRKTQGGPSCESSS